MCINKENGGLDVKKCDERRLFHDIFPIHFLCGRRNQTSNFN